MVVKWLEKVWNDPGPDQGWSWVVLFGCFLCFAGTFGISTTGVAGVLFSEFIKVYNVTRENAMWTFTVLGIAQSLSGGMMGILCNYLSLRTLLVISACSCSTAFIVCYWSSHFLYISLSFGILFGVGVGLAGSIYPLYTCQYFKKYITIASGLSQVGSSIAGFTLPAFVTWLLSGYDLQGAMLIVGGILLNLLPVAMLLRPRDGRHFFSLNVTYKVPTLLSKEESETDIAENETVPQRSQPARSGLTSSLRVYLQLFTVPMFHVITLQCLFCLNFLISVSITLTDFVMDMGLQRSSGVILLSIFAGGDLIGRIVSGFIADKEYIQRRTMSAVNLVVMGVGAFALTLTRRMEVLGVIVLVMGAMEGSANIMINVLYLQYIGASRMMAAMSLRLLLNGITALSRPFLIGIFRDQLGSYEKYYYCLGAMSIFGGLLWTSEPYLSRRMERQQQQTTTTTHV